MKKQLQKFTPKCLNFRHSIGALRALGAFVMLFPVLSYAQVTNLYYDQEMGAVPTPQRSWIERVMEEDEENTLEKSRLQIENWERNEQYVSQWNLEAQGQYAPVTTTHKRNYVGRQLLRHLEQKLIREPRKNKNNKNNLGVESIQTMSRTLAPAATETKIIEGVKVRFQVRPLQGMSTVKIENPLADVAIETRVNGRVNVRAERKIAYINATASSNYDVRRRSLVTAITKPITNEWSTQVSTTKNPETKTDSRIEVLYNTSF